VSQAPVREALRDLEALRFVEHAPYRGAGVRKVTEAELAEIYPVRAALEEVAGHAAAIRLDDEGLAALKHELSEMFAAADAGDVHRQVTHDVRFHEIIVRAAHNATLFEVWRLLRIEARTMVKFSQGRRRPALHRGEAQAGTGRASHQGSRRRRPNLA
jgi:DNA-binding GntR family transcriptional regulator